MTKKQIESIERRIQVYITQANEDSSRVYGGIEYGAMCEFAAKVMVETMNLLGCDYDILYDKDSKKLYLKGGIAND